MCVRHLILLLNGGRKSERLDLMLNPYHVISTGSDIGMVEVVTSSQTISKIQKKMAGSMGAFKDEVIFKWLQRENPEELALKMAVENVRRIFGLCSH